jgi:hypothetical protein
MTWPASDVGSTNTDADPDSPLAARQNLNDLILKFNELRNHVSALAQDLLADPDAPAMRATLELGDAAVQNTTAFWSTGDVKVTYKTVADAGWVFMNDGTIGNAASGGTTRANADTQALFTLLWTNTANAQCAVSGGRGASAAADFAANKNIALPKVLGRAIAVAGTGAGLTARVLALAMGAQDAVVVSHQHSGQTGGISANHTHSDHAHLVNSKGNDSSDSGGTVVGSNTGTVSSDHSHAFSTNATGVAATDANMPPETFANVMIKL